jgi:LmbE family N-acetylglucosaminyl deacetylase
MNVDWINRLFGQDKPSLAIITAHPDDEIIGVGAQLRHWPQAHVVFVTNGVPLNSTDAQEAGFLTPQNFALARQRESISALALAGVRLNQIHELEFPFQGTTQNLLALTGALLEKILEIQPEFVITHPYEGGHPDHDATAFATHTACDLLRSENGGAPKIIEMTSYHNRGGMMMRGDFLPRLNCEVVTRELTEDDRNFKRRLIACFKTEQNALQSFSIETERFRLAPTYDFTQAPHDGPLYYELSGQDMTGDRWRSFANETLQTILVGKHLIERMPVPELS